MKLIKNIKTISIIFVLLHLISCNKTNWYESYKEKSKDPFGLYIAYNEAEDLFEDQKVTLLNENMYDYLFHNYPKSTGNYVNYICIKHGAPKLTDSGIEDLLSFIYDGNNAFLSLNFFNSYLKEKLAFNHVNLNKTNNSIEGLKKLKGTFYLENSHFKDETYSFDRNIRANYFSEFNTSTSIVLGTTEIDGEKKPNFIKVYHGKGAVYLHLNPIVFTNYYLLKKKEDYVANVFSYVSSSNILWDPQIKSSKFETKKADNKTSIFKFFLQHKTLTWFLFVSLFGLLLFMLFNARRKQRVIPIIKPLENTTVAFTQTIASLYLKEQDHKNLVSKKIKFFLEKVRTKYLIDTNNLNAKFITQLAAKSGNNLQKTKYLIHTIIDLNKKEACSEEQLIVLQRMIDNFFNT